MSPPPQKPWTRFPDRDLFDRARAYLSSAGSAADCGDMPPCRHVAIADLLLRAVSDPALSSQILACPRAAPSSARHVSVPREALGQWRARDLGVAVRTAARLHNSSRGSVHPPGAADSAQR